MEAGSRSRHTARFLAASLALLGLIVLLMIGLGACTDLTTSDSEVTATADTSGPTPSSGTPPTEPGPGATTTTGWMATGSVSAESIAYAQSIGGRSHLDEKLYFVIGASVKTETQAKALLEGAKAVGDMQSYFIVQLSDNFEGMRPG